MIFDTEKQGTVSVFLRSYPRSEFVFHVQLGRMQANAPYDHVVAGGQFSDIDVKGNIEAVCYTWSARWGRVHP
jgi:hypothetical protein